MSSNNVIECSDGISVEVEIKSKAERMGITLEITNNELIVVKSILCRSMAR